jgi:hypothetical protein
MTATAFMLGSAGDIIGGLGIIYMIILLGLAIAIVLAPLFIWKWTRRTCKATEEVRDLLSIIYRELKASSAKNQSNMFDIAQGVAVIGNAMLQSGEGQ